MSTFSHLTSSSIKDSRDVLRGHFKAEVVNVSRIVLTFQQAGPILSDPMEKSRGIAFSASRAGAAASSTSPTSPARCSRPRSTPRYCARNSGRTTASSTRTPLVRFRDCGLSQVPRQSFARMPCYDQTPAPSSLAQIRYPSSSSSDTGCVTMCSRHHRSTVDLANGICPTDQSRSASTATDGRRQNQFA
jgi:hypothetical protein